MSSSAVRSSRNPHYLILDNLRTLELLRPIALSLTMTGLSKNGCIRVLVWCLLHKLETVRFRAASIFREVLNNPARQEKKVPLSSAKGEASKDASEQYEVELTILANAMIEQALVPVLEIVSKGMRMTINGGTETFPEQHIRTVATDLLFATSNALESNSRAQKENKQGLDKDSASSGMSLRHKILNSLLNTQNPKLKKNIFISLLYLSARSSTLSSRIWEASRRVNATGPAGGLLREMLEGVSLFFPHFLYFLISFLTLSK